MDDECRWVPFNLDDVPTYHQQIFRTFRNKISLEFLLLRKDLLTQIEGRGPAEIGLDDESSVENQRAAAEICQKYTKKMDEELKVAGKMSTMILNGLMKGYEKLLAEYNAEFADLQSDMDEEKELDEATEDMASLSIGKNQESASTRLGSGSRESTVEPQKRKLDDESPGTRREAGDGNSRPARRIRLDIDESNNARD